MSQGGLSGGLGQLQDALEKLQAVWSETREEWRDANSRHFEQEFLRPIALEFSQAYTAIQRLSDVLKQAERDCEPWR